MNTGTKKPDYGVDPSIAIDKALGGSFVPPRNSSPFLLELITGIMSAQATPTAMYLNWGLLATFCASGNEFSPNFIFNLIKFITVYVVHLS